MQMDASLSDPQSANHFCDLSLLGIECGVRREI